MNLDVCCYILASISVFDIVMLTILIHRCATLEDELRDTIDKCCVKTEIYNKDTRKIAMDMIEQILNSNKGTREKIAGTLNELLKTMKDIGDIIK